MEFCVTFKERLQERIRVESELREEKTRLLNVVKEKEGELAKERSEFTDRLQQHEQVIEVSTAFLLVSFQSCKVKKKIILGTCYRWFSRYVIAAMPVDGKQKIAH